jgi:hypothetical protein
MRAPNCATGPHVGTEELSMLPARGARGQRVSCIRFVRLSRRTLDAGPPGRLICYRDPRGPHDLHQKSHRWRGRGGVRSHTLGCGRIRCSDTCADAHFPCHGLGRGWSRGVGRQRIDSAGRACRVCGRLLVAIPSRFESATISARLTSTLQRQFKALCGVSSKARYRVSSPARCRVSSQHGAASGPSTVQRQVPARCSVRSQHGAASVRTTLRRQFQKHGAPSSSQRA